MPFVDDILDRAVGALVATAAGDALGAGYEFTHPSPDTPIVMEGGGYFRWAPGEWTDDTSMAVAIAEVAATGADIGRGAGLDAVAAQFVRWHDGEPKDIGNQTRAVLGHRDTSAAAMAATARRLTGLKGGNGSLMRTAPVALAYLHDADEAAAAAQAVSLLTHDDPRATEACAMWTCAIRHAVLHGTFDGLRLFVDAAAPATRDYWAPLLDTAETGTPRDFPRNGWVVDGLLTAWWAITTTDQSGPGHLPAALERAVRAGSDTDTTAAIAGGLLGARWGAGAVPAQWRARLHGWPGYRADDLERMAADTVRNSPWAAAQR